MEPLNVTEAGVCKLLKNLNPGKAAGPDEIPTRLLQKLAAELTPVVTSLIRQSLSSGQLSSLERRIDYGSIQERSS